MSFFLPCIWASDAQSLQAKKNPKEVIKTVTSSESLEPRHTSEPLKTPSRMFSYAFTEYLDSSPDTVEG
jgi:hypothetical protein